MDFLKLSTRPKVLRTRLYGDQEFSRFELEVLHTPILQRLYNLKQLGFTDRIYPDAVHARFNHVLGATEMVDRMAKRLAQWLKRRADSFEYAVTADTTAVTTAPQLANLVESRRGCLRLMALLHDLTHAAYGHTLEDEVNVFAEKHDDQKRQIRFYDALVAQMVYLWATEERLRDFDAAAIEKLSNLEVDRKDILAMAEELAEHLPKVDRQNLAGSLRELELALLLLTHIDAVHEHIQIDPPALLISEIATLVDPSVAKLELVLHRDVFMVDLVGNTVCADLLDYARRDAENAGLRVEFDPRFLRYLGVATVRGHLSPSSKPCIRTAIQIFTDKMRHDVLSEMSAVLKARYVINERVLFHPTKCAAGAMLGTAVQLLGLAELPGWMQVLGDQEFLRLLNAIGRNIEAFSGRTRSLVSKGTTYTWGDALEHFGAASGDMAHVVQGAVQAIVGSQKEPGALTLKELDSLTSRVRAARNVLWRLTSRRFPKLAYRIRTAHHGGGESDETIARTYAKPEERYKLERAIEELCHLPTGSVFVHCPKRKTSMKLAEALVMGADVTKAAHLRNVVEVSPEGLGPYQQEIRAIEDMYLSIWQFHAYVDPAYWHKQPLVEWAFARLLKFPNDQLLTAELSKDPDEGPYQIMFTKLWDEVPPKRVPQIVRRVDEELVARARFAQEGSPEERLRQIIREVLSDDEAKTDGQLELPDMDSRI